MTRHSLERAKERANLTSNAATKFIDNAILYGQDASQLPSRERAYLQRKCNENIRALYYSNYCFIIADGNVCVTMYLAPAWFGKKSNYDGKIQVRNPKKYFTRYCLSNLISN